MFSTSILNTIYAFKRRDSSIKAALKLHISAPTKIKDVTAINIHNIRLGLLIDLLVSERGVLGAGVVLELILGLRPVKWRVALCSSELGVAFCTIKFREEFRFAVFNNSSLLIFLLTG